MKLLYWLPALALVAFTGAASNALAFTSVTSDGYPSAALATPLADPEDIANDMANQQSSGVAIVNTFGGTTLGFTGAGDGASADGPFLQDPAASTVPSKQEGW